MKTNPKFVKWLSRVILSCLVAAMLMLAVDAAYGQTTPNNGPSVIYLPVISRPSLVPLYVTSYYIQNEAPSEMWKLGQSLGIRDRDLPGQQDSLVILDFGKMWLENEQYTIRRFGNPNDGDRRRSIPLQDVENSVKAFIEGYIVNSGQDQTSLLTVGVGTNNFDDMNIDGDPYKISSNQNALRNTAYNFGREYAYMIARLSTWVAQSGLHTRVVVAGAIDIEWSGPEDRDGYYWWMTPYVTHGWVIGFTEHSTIGQIYFNYGACVGCPIFPSLGWRYLAAMPWTQADVYHVSWGAYPAFPIPEIYSNNGTLAKQWQAVSKYGALYLSGRMGFPGVMTQYQACQQKLDDDTCPVLDNTPEQGWTQLYEELNKDPMTSVDMIRWVTDIRWQYR